MELEPVSPTTPISFAHWQFEFGPFNGPVVEALTKVVTETLESSPPEARLPCYWSKDDGIAGPAVDDPLTIYVMLPFSSAEIDDGPEWKFCVRDLIIYEFPEVFTHGKDSEDAAEEAEKLAKLSSALRELADEIDDAVLRVKHPTSS